MLSFCYLVPSLLSALHFVVVIAKRTGPIAFSYDPFATHGPSNWSALPFQQNACGWSRNSPIDLNRTACEIFADYTFENGNCTLGDIKFDLLNHAVDASYPITNPNASDSCTPSHVKVPKEDGPFDLGAFHIHAGSEHSLNGEFYSAELHMVYRTKERSRLAIFGIFMSPDAKQDHLEFDKLLQEWEKEYHQILARCSKNVTKSAQETRRMSKQGSTLDIFNVPSLIPVDAGFYRYEGSLTTPPCSEIVTWNVASQPLSISPNQLTKLIKIILNYRDPTTCQIASAASPNGTTSRPIQPQNGRRITHVCPKVKIKSSITVNTTMSAGCLTAASIATLTISVLYVVRSKRQKSAVV